MKYLITLCVLFQGCASISEYNQGCRDGIATWVLEKQNAWIEPPLLEKSCDNIELKRERERRVRVPDMSVFGRRH